MSDIVPLEEAFDDARFGSKAVGLGQAIRDGLPVPPGFALSGAVVEAVASENPAVTDDLMTLLAALPGPLAVRSSAADEDGADASFAGQHLTLLNVPTIDGLPSALMEIWWSANSDSAITYRQRLGLFARPVVGVVVQSLLDPKAAGVMFTRNPLDQSDERIVEASWGLGEGVVAGMVIPDHIRMDRTGRVVEIVPGLKKIAIRSSPDGGTFHERIAPDLAETVCLEEAELAALTALADRCEAVYGPGRDIEWALMDGTVYLLQCRAITR